MIFLTVGGQLPFDRMVDVVDLVAPKINEPIFGQIGKTNAVPKNFESVNFLTPQEFQAQFSKARLVIGHAGIGTILTAIEMHKPVALMARRAALGEHRNDHQLATVEQLSQIRGVHIFEDEGGLLELLETPNLEAPGAHESTSKGGLIDFLRDELAHVANGSH